MPVFYIEKGVSEMNETIRYVVADPCGNTTALVLDPVPETERKVLANELMAAEGADVEQVAYITMKPTEDVDLRVDMMGGEFCGNATRSAAVYAAVCDGASEGQYGVSCSGCDSLLKVDVSQKEDGTYYAATDMPIPESITGLLLAVEDMPRRFFRVDFNGIVHYVYLTMHLDAVDKNVYWQALQEYLADEPCGEAYGLILYDPRSCQMIPAVYVKDTDTVSWEQSCGSGTAAAAVVVAFMSHHDYAADVKQPGGVIHVEAVPGEETIESLRIGSPVALGSVQQWKR